MNTESKGNAKISFDEYANRLTLVRVSDLLPIARREMVGEENLQQIADKLKKGIGVLTLMTHPAQKETLEYYHVIASHHEIALYEICVGIAAHQKNLFLDVSTETTGLTLKYINTPETLRKYEKKKAKLESKNKPTEKLGPAPKLYDGVGELTTFSTDLLARGGLVGLFPQGTRSPQLEAEDDMKALSRLSLITHKRHGVDFAVVHIGVDMVGMKSTQDYIKNKGMISFLRRYRWNIGEVEMLSDILAKPEVGGDYRKLDEYSKNKFKSLVSAAYINEPNPDQAL